MPPHPMSGGGQRVQQAVKIKWNDGAAPGAREAILKRKEETRKLLEAIEHRIGMTIDELMKDIDYEN